MTLVDWLNAKLSLNLWGKVLLAVCHDHNRISFRKIQISVMNYEREENQIWNILKYKDIWPYIEFMIQRELNQDQE